MSKYSFEEKCEAVQRVLDGMSICESARILGVGHSQVQRWYRLYNNHGFESLRNGGATYDGSFKIMVVEYMHNKLIIKDSDFKSAAEKADLKSMVEKKMRPIGFAV